MSALSEFKVGATWTFYILWTANGVGQDLTGCALTMKFRNRKNMEVAATVSDLSGELSISEEDAGRVDVNIPPSVTETFSEADYEFDLKYSFPSGEVRFSPTVYFRVRKAVSGE